MIELGIRRAWMMVGVLGLTLGVLTGSAEASEGAAPSSRSFADAFFVSTRAMPDGQGCAVSNGLAPASFGR